MFTTTEEYMSKKMYGKSQYTGEYYADRIKVTHGNDGPRGMMNDILIIDSSSLYPFDELVINKDFEKDPNDYEETYIYFPVTAPFSPLSDSPNARYGLAIKEKEVEPKWADEHIILDMASQELANIASEAWWGITTDIYPTSIIGYHDVCRSVFCRCVVGITSDKRRTGHYCRQTDYCKFLHLSLR